MSHTSHSAARSALRWSAVVLLVANAAIHLYLVPEHLEEVPYIGVLFIALAAASMILAALLTFRDNALAWVATVSLNLLALAAYVISRTSGLPGHSHDIGNWTEPLGVATIVAEVLIISLVTYGLVGGDIRESSRHENADDTESGKKHDRPRHAPQRQQ